MPDNYIKKNQQEGEGTQQYMLDLFDVSMKKRGCNWTPEILSKSIREYFDYCVTNSLKPSKSGLRLFLGASRTQYYAWQTESVKYGEISNLINTANDIMETQYVQNIEKFSTGNMFLLRTSHNHVEKSQVDVNTSTSTTAEDVDEAIKKLGLDK